MQVASTENGIIFGNIVYDVTGALSDRNCVVLSGKLVWISVLVRFNFDSARPFEGVFGRSCAGTHFTFELVCTALG